MRIICVGLPKTGTSSLRDALLLLGYGPRLGFNNAHCERYLNGDINGLVAELAPYQFAHDWPWCLMYEAIYQAYPDTVFILTKRRSVNDWFSSLKSHADRKHERLGPERISMRSRVFGYENPMDNRIHHIQFYRTHIQKVRSFFGDRGTLVELSWDSGHGWRQLCAALGKEVPDTPFPHVNKRR